MGMASIIDDFELGAAAISDKVGITDHWAADIFTAQESAPTATPQERDLVRAQAAAAEDAGAISQAWQATKSDIREEVSADLSAVASPLSKVLWGAAIVAVGVALLVYAPELKAVARRVAG